MIHLVNRKNWKVFNKIPGKQIVIMRGTPLGNMYPLGKYSRAESIELYGKTLWNDMKRKGPMYEELIEIIKQEKAQTVILICCCKPLPCHGHTVLKAIEWIKQGGVS